MKKKHVILLLSSIFIAVLLFGLHKWASQPYERIENKIRNLKTEQMVINMLGPPHKVFLNNSHNYYIKGYSYKRRDITNKVLVYFPSNNFDVVVDMVLYIYIDNDGNVEEYYIGGS